MNLAIGYQTLTFTLHFPESSIVGMNVLDSLFQGFTRSFTHVEIPKFKVETALDLKATLQGMGMTAACDPSLADFSGITKQRMICLCSVVLGLNKTKTVCFL